MERLSVRKIRKKLNLKLWHPTQNHLVICDWVNKSISHLISTSYMIKESIGDFQSLKFPVYTLSCPGKNNLDYSMLGGWDQR